MSTVAESSSFLVNTLKRRHQKRQEVTKILQEGISSLHLSTNNNHQEHSSSSEGIYRLVNINPDSYLLDEGEERTMLEPSSSHDPNFKQTIEIILNWLNVSLTKYSILIRSLEDDLYDGYILNKLIEVHQSDLRESHDEIPLSEESRKNTLRAVLDSLENCFLQQNQPIKWTFDRIYNRDFIAILHLLLALMKLWNVKTYYNLPKNLILKVIVVKKSNGLLQTRIANESFIEDDQREQPSSSFSRQNDLIDTLFDFEPQKISHVEKTILHFLNHHLRSFNIHVPHIDAQYFQDGLCLLYLISQLENYFLILNKYHHKKPMTREQSYENIQLAFELMKQVGIPVEEHCRINDILHGNQRSLYRILFRIYLRYNPDSSVLFQSISPVKPLRMTPDSSLL